MLRWVGAVAVVLLLTAQNSWADAYSDAFARGEAARKSGDFRDAEQAYKDALAAKSDSVEALNSLALVQAYQQDYGHALDTIGRAETLAPNDDDIRLTSARILAWAGRYAEAERKIAVVTRAHPNDAEALALEGRIAFYQNKRDAARESFQKALRADPNNLDAILGLGDLAQASGNHAEAETYFLKGKAIAPTSKDVADRLARKEPTTPKWRLDGSATHSWLSRTTLDDWSEQSLALSRRFGSDTYGSFGVFRAHRFGLEDVELSVGVVTPLMSHVTGSLAVGVTPNDDFLPAWRFTPSFNIDVTDQTIVLVEGNVKHYSTGTVKSANLGLQQYTLNGRINVTARFISSWDSINHYISGWSVGVGVSPLDRLRLRGSYADAPESEAGVVAGTKTWAAGISFDVTPTVELRLDYAHENRERAYIREDLIGGFAVRF